MKWVGQQRVEIDVLLCLYDTKGNDGLIQSIVLEK